MGGFAIAGRRKAPRARSRLRPGVGEGAHHIVRTAIMRVVCVWCVCMAGGMGGGGAGSLALQLKGARRHVVRVGGRRGSARRHSVGGRWVRPRGFARGGRGVPQSKPSQTTHDPQCNQGKRASPASAPTPRHTRSQPLHDARGNVALSSSL